MSLLNGIKPPQSYFDELMSFLDSYFQNRSNKLIIYLEAGHFNSRIGVDDFALTTLKDATDLGTKLIKKYQKNIRLVYGILVDDLGMACSEDSCSLTSALNSQEKKNTAGLPVELETFITSHPLIKRDKLMIFSERTSKNRAIESIKKKIKLGANELTVTDADDFKEIKIVPPVGTPFLLAKYQGSVFTAKCPAIMSQHYKDVLMKLKQRFLEADEFIIIDWSEMSDRIKVMQGKYALPFMQDTDCATHASIVNIFFGDDEGRITDVKYSEFQSMDQTKN